MRPVNLLPEQHRPRRGTGERQGSAYVALGVLGALFLCVLVYALTASQVGSRQSEAANVKREATEAEAKLAALGRYGNFAQIKQTRATSVKALAGARFDWERLMRELAHVLPEGTWLTEVEASVSPDPEATKAAAAGAASGPSAKIAGCAPRQPDVARLMVRLRGMHRVTEVTLKESAAEEQSPAAGQAAAGPTASTGGADAGCGDLYGFDLTVTFEAAPATPADAAGATRVPASLGGGS
jgi:Tfp pilus assembly protein PilN